LSFSFFFSIGRAPRPVRATTLVPVRLPAKESGGAARGAKIESGVQSKIAISQEDRSMARTPENP
jgi:hypothetical protein